MINTTVVENLGLVNLFGVVAPLANVVMLLSPYHHIQDIGYYFPWEERDKRYHGIKGGGAHLTYHVKDYSSQSILAHWCVANDVKKEEAEDC